MSAAELGYYGDELLWPLGSKSRNRSFPSRVVVWFAVAVELAEVWLLQVPYLGLSFFLFNFSFIIIFHL